MPAEPPHEGERFDTLLHHKNLVVEHIINSSAVTPCEYVQPHDERVVLVEGEAVLQVAGESLALKPGDHLFLPAGVPHTVERASHSAMWLAVHLHPDPKQASTPNSALDAGAAGTLRRQAGQIGATLRRDMKSRGCEISHTAAGATDAQIVMAIMALMRLAGRSGKRGQS